MKKFDRFILKGFVGPFLAVLLVVVFILMMQFLWLYIDELVGKGLKMSVILEFLMWGACTILPLAIPLATLLAAVMTMGTLGENNELMAIRAAGIPLTRVMAPMIGTSLLISVGAFFIGDNLVPKAYNEIFTLRDDIGRTKDAINIPTGIFYEGIEGYVLRIGDKDGKSGMMYDVMVYNNTSRQGNTSLTIADSAVLKMSKKKDYLTFSMYDGCSYREDNEINYRDTLLKLNRVTFDRQDLVIPLHNYSFEKSDSARFDDQVKSMNYAQLKHIHDSVSHRLDSIYLKSARFLAKGPFFSFPQQLDTAFINKNATVFSAENFLEFEPSAGARACEEASTKLENLRMEIETVAMNNYIDIYYKTHSYVELLKMFAQALACILLFFIGAPLGALISKGGLGTGAIIAALFFVLYWVIDISGTRLASNGAVDGLIGAFVSAMVMAPIGAYLTWKATHDATTIQMDHLKIWWRKQKSLIMRIFHPVRIVYMGTPEFAVAPLDNLVRNRYNVVGVVTVADKPSGRGLKLNESAVKKYAVEHNIPVLQPLKLKDPEFLQQLRDLKADMFVVVAFRMLPREVWEMPKLGTFNLHAALLPQYRGAAPINWAVINGERRTGVTSFMIDDHIDTGGILLRESCSIGPEETAGDVHDRLMELGSKVVLQTVEGLIQHNIETRKQAEYIQGDEVLLPAPKLTPESCRIDWNGSTARIYNLIRGLSPFPTAWTMLQKEEEEPVMLKIFFARKSERSGLPGQILSDGKSYLSICTADGALDITDLQLSGKKRMDVKAFLAGWREPEKFKAI